MQIEINESFRQFVNTIGIVKYFLAFISVIFIDFAWARYTKNAADSKALPAASWSAVIGVLGLFNFYLFLTDFSVVFSELLGSFTGTYIAVKYPNVFQSFFKSFFPRKM